MALSSFICCTTLDISSLQLHSNLVSSLYPSHSHICKQKMTIDCKAAALESFLLGCCNSVADLHDGELIHGENFNLFAAMSALEVLLLSVGPLSFDSSEFRILQLQ